MQHNSSDQAGGRLVETWTRALLASDLDDASKVAGVGLAEFADWHTGENVRPAMSTLGRRIHKSRERTGRAVGRLVETGWLVHTDNAERGVKVYRLALSGVTGASHLTDDQVLRVRHTWDVSGVTGASHLNDSGVTPTGSGVTLTTSRCDASVTQPLHTSSERSEEEDEEEGATAPVATLPAASRLTPEALDAARAISAAMRSERAPDFWRAVVLNVVMLAPALDSLLSAGWDAEQIIEHALSAGKPRTNPTGLLVRHLAALSGVEPPPRPVTVWDRLAAADVKWTDDLANRLPRAHADPWWDEREVDGCRERINADEGTRPVLDLLAALRAAERAGYAPLDLVDAPVSWADVKPCHAPGCEREEFYALDDGGVLYPTCTEHTGQHAHTDEAATVCQECGVGGHIVQDCEAYWESLSPNDDNEGRST